MKMKLSFLSAAIACAVTAPANAETLIANLDDGGVPVATVFADLRGNGVIVNPAGFAYTLACGLGYVHAVTGDRMQAYRITVHQGGIGQMTEIPVQQMLRAIAADPAPADC